MGADAAPTKEFLIALYQTGLNECLRGLRPLTEADWLVPAGTLEWSCRETVDHITDCIFSYALQVAGRVQSGWLKLQELHATPEASPAELLDSFSAVGEMFKAVLSAAPQDVTASDAVFDLRLSDWVARSLNEMLLHTHDVLAGLGETFQPSPALCSFVLSTTTLWMYDAVEDRGAADAWQAMLKGSGRLSTSSDRP